MNARVPALAAPTPPETGASKHKTCLLAAYSCTRTLVVAATVEQSINNAPAGIASRTVCSSSNRSSTILPFGSIVSTTSALATAAAALSAAAQPASTAFCRATAETSNAVTRNPLLLKFAAIGLPMLPRPMKATVCSALLNFLPLGFTPPLRRTFF